MCYEFSDSVMHCWSHVHGLESELFVYSMTIHSKILHFRRKSRFDLRLGFFSRRRAVKKNLPDRLFSSFRHSRRFRNVCPRNMLAQSSVDIEDSAGEEAHFKTLGCTGPRATTRDMPKRALSRVFECQRARHLSFMRNGRTGISVTPTSQRVCSVVVPCTRRGSSTENQARTMAFECIILTARMRCFGIE
jgi:hypothetical protein